ncbi:SMC-Scp complex subunit ScpB [Candidatus Woesearchaeota archaeon]|nr:SMC-Scp complex subunit ScpB [Candidatus Woesearchaeota archaeon]
MVDIKKQVETLLFATGRSLTLKELSELTKQESLEDIKKALDDLKRDYTEKDSALHLVGENDIWKIAVKPEYAHMTSNLYSKTEFDKSLLETLSVIAWKQPIVQADVVKVRGTLTYDHVKILKELGYIESEKFGRSRKLKLTAKFYDYFDVSKKELEGKFKDVKDVSQELEKTAKEKNIEPFSTPIPDKPLI